MKKVISFDLDGTLVDACYGDMVWNHGIPLEYSKKYNIPFNDARTMIRTHYETVGDGDILWYEIDHWLEKLSVPVSPEELLRRYEPYIKPLPYAGEVLKELAKKYLLIIASNAARCFVEKELEVTGFRHYFASVVSATTDYGTIKKEEGFYHRICESLQVKPSEIVHVGDHPVFDHDVPSGVGIESYYLTNKESDEKNSEGRRIVKNLKQLLEIL